MSDLKEYNEKDELLKSLSIYYTSIINIKNYGDDTNSIELIENSEPSADISSPEWFKDNRGSGIIIKSNKFAIDLKIKCVNDGMLNIYFRNMDVRDKENNEFPVYIDYTSIIINNEEHITKNKLICAYEPIIIGRKVKNNELITIHAEWKPFTSSSLFENKKVKELEEVINKKDQRIEELEEENKNLKRKLSLISNSSLLEIRKIKKEL